MKTLARLIFIFFSLPIFSQFTSVNNASNITESSSQAMAMGINTKEEGTKYYTGDWSYGQIELNDTLVQNKQYVIFDMQNNAIMLSANKEKKDLSAKAYFFSSPKATGFQLVDSKGTPTAYFKKISSKEFADYGISKDYYYEVIDKENLSLLKRHIVEFVTMGTASGFGANKSTSKYKHQQVYYIKDHDKYKEVKLTKSSILKTLSDKKNELTSFSKKQKLSFSKEEDLIKLIDYYHSLP